MTIHPTAVIAPKAEIDSDVEIGAYVVIAGLRLDTSQPDDGAESPGWSKDVKAGLVNGPFRKRHYPGL